MKRILAILPLLAVLALPGQSAAQFSDGDVNHVAFEGTGGYYAPGGVHLPFYEFDVTGIPGTPYWDFLCVDNLNYIRSGDNYDARFTSVEMGDLSYTREGSDQIRMGNAASDALKNYRITAYLYKQAAGADNMKLANIQKAAWFATNPGYGAGDNTLYAAAKAAVDAGWKANNFYVVTASADRRWEAEEQAMLIRAVDGKQEYLVYVPEPEAIFLLATSLFGVALVGRRRRLIQDS